MKLLVHSVSFVHTCACVTRKYIGRCTSRMGFFFEHSYSSCRHLTIVIIELLFGSEMCACVRACVCAC